jgi:cation diffusion facilitator CzcD-associated flavoprotein CzcO
MENGINGHPSTNSTSPTVYDTIIIGAGFSGIATLHRLRKLGLSCRVLESGDDFGGVWHWNRYPGARVDSEWPFYQLSIPEVYRDWQWSEKFPGSAELRRYFAHVDTVLDLRKDVTFNAHVNDVQWNGGGWTTKTRQGHIFKSKYLILCTGLLHQAFTPNFPGIENYKGALYHTSDYPEQVHLSGKRVAVIGAGATAVQVVQEVAKQAQHLTVFMRRPSICLPMCQRTLGDHEQTGWKTYFEALFRDGRKSATGFPGRQSPYGAVDVSEEDRERFLEELWRRGAFNYTMFNYRDIMISRDSNRLVYDFWQKKTSPRLRDARKRELMVPKIPPYYFGTKRCPLEQDYYEMLDRDNVEIASLVETPIQTFVETGIMTDRQKDFDVVILATGFDSFSGS